MQSPICGTETAIGSQPCRQGPSEHGDRRIHLPSLSWRSPSTLCWLARCLAAAAWLVPVIALLARRLVPHASLGLLPYALAAGLVTLVAHEAVAAFSSDGGPHSSPVRRY